MSTEIRTPIWFLLARAHRLAYLQIPKVACTSMRAALCRLNRPDLPEEQLLERGAFARHPEWSDLVEPTDSIVQKCFRFTFVRHPYDRFASFYRSKIGKRSDEQIKPHFRKMGLRAGLSAEEVFDRVESLDRETIDPHLAPQNYFVSSKGSARVQFIGRLERLDEGVEEVAAKSGTALKVPRLNATHELDAARSREMLGESLRRKLANYYADDFSTFGYEA